jgi:transposase-like protein
MELVYVMSHLNTEEKCISYLEKERWNNQPKCPYCNSINSSPKELRYTCLTCKSSYSVKVKTVFENSNLSLTKWFLAISLILSAKKGISSLQLARDISVNKNTSWLLQKKIRKAMKEDGLLSGLVEIDETFIGGLSKNRHYHKKQKKTDAVITGSYDKKPVLGMLERSGKIITRVMTKAWGNEIIPIMNKIIEPSSTVITDGFGGYYYANQHFKEHQVLNHTKHIYRKGDYHTNTIEGFWGILKRSIVGQFHRVNNSYLQSYVDEVAFKYNHRDIEDRGFTVLLNQLLKPKLP